MYRNIFYNNNKSEMVLWTWDDKGNRVEQHHPFKPYIFVESQSYNDGMSIYNTPLRKIEFKNQFDRSKYIKTSGIKRIFYNIQVEQQFLIDHFGFQNQSVDFSQHPLKIFFIDIETYSPDEFPNPKEATNPINVITIYNSLDKTFYTWGLDKPYKNKDTKHIYFQCINESDLLKRFVKFWYDDPCDIVSGWNCEGFDIPYIINRITNILGEDWAKKLSPVGQLYCREGVVKRFGKIDSKWYIKGVSILDYMEIYKVFSRLQRESYSLHHIGEEELGEGKLTINATSLSQLAENNWNQFIDYNIQDVNILVKLEEKLQFLKLCRMLGYLGLTQFESALGTISIVTGAMALKAKEKNLIIPTFAHSQRLDYSGGFVKEPDKGFKEAIISFDANSLYPNTIITLNISPETKIGKIANITDTEIVIKLVNTKEYRLTKEQFVKFIKKEQIAITKAKILYTQKIKGFCPELVEGIYQDRVKNKNEMKRFKIQQKQLEKELKHSTKQKLIDKISFLKKQLEIINDQINKLDIKQYTLKILANRIYGTFANKHSPFCDVDAASSITMTGQNCVKQASEIINKYALEKYNINGLDLNIYSDTDSCYFTIKPILDKLNIPFFINEKMNPKIVELSDEFEKILNAAIISWAKNELNSKDPRFVFKRETICDSAIFIQKKRYITHVLNEEGVDENKFKYTGVEVVSTAIPKKVKPLIKEIVETMIMTRNYQQTNNIYKKAFEEFKKLSIEELAFPRGIHNYEKYEAKSNNFTTGKGTPIHVKASIYYNQLLNKLHLTHKYEKIKSGMKVKFFYATPNKYNISVLSFIDKYPKEFDININKTLMFEKIVYAAVERLFNAVGWQVTDPNREAACNLFELLS